MLFDQRGFQDNTTETFAIKRHAERLKNFVMQVSVLEGDHFGVV